MRAVCMGLKALCLSFALVIAPLHAAEQVDAASVALWEPQVASVARGSGPVCQDRAAWGAAAVQTRGRELITGASALLIQAFPAWDDTAYLEYSRNGQRRTGERMMNARKAWLYPLVMAECLEGAGRFLPAIELTLKELVTQPTWTWPAHDRTLRSFRNHDYEVDLLAADTAHDLAQTLYMLGDWLSPSVRKQTMAALEVRVFAPMRRSFSSGGKDHWWLNADHNWNAACLKGVVGAALAVLPERQDRALFVAAGNLYIHHYLDGFSSDGYTAEGPGYWNYGFSHFTALRELLWQTTAGKLDLFATAKVRNMVLYGYGVEMLPGNVAAFGDASRNTRMDDFTRAYGNQALGLGMPQLLASLPLVASRSQQSNDAPIANAVMTLFAQPVLSSAGEAPRVGLHTYFDQPGVLVSRPAPGGKLSVSIKAGGNANHSHNDIGSYTIALGAEQPVGDPGKTDYTSKTFSAERYSIRGINSWGHPVPRIDEILQREATRLHPKVLATDFSEAADEISIDLADAYEVPGIRTLVRTMRHERDATGRVLIEDRFDFDRERRFETAITLSGEWRRVDDKTLEFWQKQERLRATVESSAPWILVADKINEEGLAFTRVAIVMQQAQKQGFIRLRYEPARP